MIPNFLYQFLAMYIRHKNHFKQQILANTSANFVFLQPIAPFIKALILFFLY
jgi:hypothetical protein